MRRVALDKIKKLEETFEIKIELKDKLSYNGTNCALVIKDYPAKLINFIEKELNDLIKSKKVNNYSTDFLPGLDKLFKENTAFSMAITAIEGNLKIFLLKTLIFRVKIITTLNE